ncbi:invasion associated locus B family protein [Lichenihabitans psoromatis]|uniref:invasion associated locus B family protein n=1 Tax=Lichenihabitans psoromatis TaxID=2528642 RepID=UPI001036BCF9|nr:invasion associated locus B family protein [Lichenihabitans psoromatis]
MSARLLSIFGPIVVVLSFSQAAAQQKPVTPAAKPLAPVSSEPATTSASYGDWVLRCGRIGDGDQAKRVCEVAQTIQLPNQTAPIAEVAVGHLPDGSLHLTAVLPPSVSFPSTVAFANAGDKARVDLQWRRCLAGGCFADTPVSDDLLKAWRVSTDAGKMTFKDAGGRDIALAISFRGLAQALDALPKS